MKKKRPSYALKRVFYNSHLGSNASTNRKNEDRTIVGIEKVERKLSGDMPGFWLLLFK
jgi:hypothetical protein